ncbi:hypothetical protein [Streptomyces jumonjinensis]|uniref:hypothetical protein n=1 Tax=Streptomyces jumonjinensis TaxID=1945 RepID=UPI0037AF50EF
MSSTYQITGYTGQGVSVVAVHIAAIDQEPPLPVSEIGIVDAVRAHLLSLSDVTRVSAVRTTRVQTQV